MNLLAWIGALAGVYAVGAWIIARWLDRWDLAYRPGHGGDMTRAGMLFGCLAAAASFAWMISLLWLAAKIISAIFR